VPSKKQAKPLKGVYELKITLENSDPPIWRRFAVPANVTLETLHDVIQIVMGWEECHLHQFITKDKKYYGAKYPGLGFAREDETIDERKVKLSELMPRRKARLVYEYDFGDGWRHMLEVIEIGTPEPGVRYPVCLAGERACPPEDCGGIWGYYNLLEAIIDPKHENHDDMVEWLGGPFDPEHFDLKEINRLLKSIR